MKTKHKFIHKGLKYYVLVEKKESEYYNYFFVAIYRAKEKSPIIGCNMNIRSTSYDIIDYAKNAINNYETSQKIF